jgi:8-oxo-dGTP pyrophosphatase MutT (NUDIX family)
VINTSNGSDEKFAIPVVCVIIERKNERGKEEVLLQLRSKPKEPAKYTGSLEIPGGRVDEGETIEEAVRREVLEETGLHVRIVPESLCIGQRYLYDETTCSYSFRPFTCVQVIGDHSYVGLFVLCRVTGGSLKDTFEARGHHWISVSSLEQLVREKKIFPVVAPGLMEYLKRFRCS